MSPDQNTLPRKISIANNSTYFAVVDLVAANLLAHDIAHVVTDDAVVFPYLHHSSQIIPKLGNVTPTCLRKIFKVTRFQYIAGANQQTAGNRKGVLQPCSIETRTGKTTCWMHCFHSCRQNTLTYASQRTNPIPKSSPQQLCKIR